MEIDAITKLIKKFAEYHQATSSSDIEGFTFWLLKQLADKPQQDSAEVNYRIGYYINRINRYGKYLSRYFLDNMPISTIDEFSFLMAIKALPNPSKTEVYEHTVTELTTGQQMMRRLIKLGLVQERVDEQDKRLRRVFLTEQGERVRQLAHAEIQKECDLVFEALPFGKRQELLLMLEQIDQLNEQSYKEVPKLN